MLGNKGLDLGGVGCHDLKALRQGFDIFKSCWTHGIAPQCLANGFIKLGWQGSFQDDHGDTGSQMLARHLDAIGSMGVDSDAIGILCKANRGQAIWPAQILPKLPDGTVKETFCVLLLVALR